MKLKASKEELYELYWEKEYSLADIGKMFNCARETVRNRFQKLGIRRREGGVNTEKIRKNHIIKNTGENNPFWKGGIIQDADGYVYILKPEHPGATKTGYVKRSHLVAEKMLGRYLYPDEITHHKNGIRNDDRPENIKVTTRKKHVSFHRGRYGRLEAKRSSSPA